MAASAKPRPIATRAAPRFSELIREGTQSRPEAPEEANIIALTENRTVIDDDYDVQFSGSTMYRLAKISDNNSPDKSNIAKAIGLGSEIVQAVRADPRRMDS
jgi:hypothetical protein